MLHRNVFLGVVILLTTFSSETKCCSSCSGKTNASPNSLDQQMPQVYYSSAIQSPQVVQYPSQIPPAQPQPQLPQPQPQQQPLSSSVSSNKPPATKSNSQSPSAPGGGKIPVNLVPDVLIFELLLTSPLWSSLSNSLRGCILNKLETEAQSSLRYLITEGEGGILQQLATVAAAPPLTPSAPQSASAAAPPTQIYGYQISGQQPSSSYVLAKEQPMVSSQTYVPSSGQNGYGTINQGSSVYSSPNSYQQTNAVYQR